MRSISIKWCHFQWHWTNPNPVFKVTPLFDAKHLTNGYRYGHSYYKKRIGNRTQAFEWTIEWPVSQISRSRYYLTSNDSQMVQDRAVIEWRTWKVIHGLSNRTILNDLERPQTQISWSGHLWRRISPKWLNIRPKLLWKANRKPYPSFQVTRLRFQGYGVIGPIDTLDVLCVQLTRDLFAIAKFLFTGVWVLRPSNTVPFRNIMKLRNSIFDRPP